MRVSVTVKASFPGVALKPGAISLTISGDSRTPATATKISNAVSVLTADRANLNASFLPEFVRYSLKTGTNVMLKEPSANNLLKRLGILKATKKASALRPAPKTLAITISLINPKIRLNNVAAPTIPAATVTFDFSETGWG